MTRLGIKNNDLVYLAKEHTILNWCFVLSLQYTLVTTTTSTSTITTILDGSHENCLNYILYHNLFLLPHKQSIVNLHTMVITH